MKEPTTIAIIFRDGTHLAIENVLEYAIIQGKVLRVVMQDSPDALFINAKEVLYTGALRDVTNNVTEIQV